MSGPGLAPPRVPPLRWGVALPLLLAVAAQVELHLSYSAEEAQGEVLSPVNAAVAALATLPLALSGRAPLLAPLVATGAWAAEPLVAPVSNTFAVPIAVIVVSPVLAVLSARSWSRAVLAAAGVVLLDGLQGVGDGRDDVGSAVANAVFAACAAVVGGVLRRHTEQRRGAEARAELERAAREEGEQALACERARIARELHDVVGHGISVVLLQARGARRVLASDPERAREALDEVEQVAARALHEMRLLMGVLRLPTGAPAPQPGLADLPALADGVRGTGTTVALRLPAPVPELPAALDVSCYRVVQEALTNALRHAPGAAVEVTVRCEGGCVVLEVVNGTPPGRAPRPPGPPTVSGRGGHGLLGVRERVDLFGGSLHSGPLPGGGFELRAALPVHPAPPASAAAPLQEPAR